MAKPATRSSFGFDKTSSTPTSPSSSLSSSPPTSFRTPKSRLPVRNRHGSLTPGSGQSGSTATRIALTPILNRNTPSPHPLPEDSLQVKLMSIYGRIEVSRASFPFRTSANVSSLLLLLSQTHQLHHPKAIHLISLSQKMDNQQGGGAEVVDTHTKHVGSERTSNADNSHASCSSNDASAQGMPIKHVQRRPSTDHFFQSLAQQSHSHQILLQELARLKVARKGRPPLR